MENNQEKISTIRKIVWILAFVIAFELFMLFLQVPVRGGFFWITAGSLVLLFVYLIILCLKILKGTGGSNPR